MATGGTPLSFGSGNNEIIRRQVELAFNTSGQQGLIDLQSSISGVQTRLDLLGQSFNVGAIGGREFMDQTRPLVAEMARLEQAAKMLEDALNRGAMASKNAGLAGTAASRGILEFSRAVEDFTVAGPLGALNNIPGIFYSIGQAMNLPMAQVNLLTTAVSLTATAVYAVWRNWSTIRQLWDDGGTKTEAERMEELAGKTHKTAAEQKEYNKLKKEQHDIEEMLTHRTEEQEKTKKAVGDVISDMGTAQRPGGERIVDAMVAMRKRQGDLMDQMNQREKQEFADAVSHAKFLETIGGGAVRAAPIVAEARENMRKQIEQRLRQEGAERLQAARLPGGGMEALLAEIGKAPELFPPNLAKRLQGATAEGRAKAKDFEAFLEHQGKDADEQAKLRKQDVLDQARTMQTGMADDIIVQMAEGIVGLMKPETVGRKAREAVKRRLAASGTPEDLLEDATTQVSTGLINEYRRRAARAGFGAEGVTEQQAAADVLAQTRKEKEAARLAKHEQTDEAKAEREHNQQVAHLATSQRAALQGATGRVLTDEVQGALDRGQNVDAIVQALSARARRRLRGNAVIPPELVGDVADQIIRNEATKQAPQVQGLGLGAIQMKQVGKEVAAGNRQLGQMQRVGKQNQMQADTMALMAEDPRLNQMQALALVKRTYALAQRGVPMQMGLAIAYEQLAGQMNRLEQMQVAAVHKFEQALRQNNTQRGHMLSNRFPGLGGR